MKIVLSILFIFFGSYANGQIIIKPGKNIVPLTYLGEEGYSMKWYISMDSSRQEIAEVFTTISKENGNLIISQKVKRGNMPISWIDSSIAVRETLLPIHHFSFNAQRNIVLDFEPDIGHGYYKDNFNRRTTQIHDTVKQMYFDSNIYPFLISCLPLKVGYAAQIPVYDYGDDSHHGIVYVKINVVRKDHLKRSNGDLKEVFVIDVLDGINNANSAYYVSIKDHSVLEINTFIGKNKMQMIRNN